MATKDDAVAELAQAFALLWRRLRVEAAAQDDALTIAHSSVLSRLAKLGRLTTAELARAEGMKPQSMGTIVAALEELGLVAREPHPTDGRQLLVSLTPAGEAVRKRARDAKLSWLAQAVARLDKADQAALFAASGVLRKLVES